jgi:hypothetical protein
MQQGKPSKYALGQAASRYVGGGARQSQAELSGYVPVVVESLGGWHEDAAAVVNKIARQLGSHTGKEAEEPIRHFFQRLSLLLWRDDQCHAGGLAGDKPVLLLLLRLVGSGAECLGD